jgi:ATP-dependent DNA helicase DinG
MPGTNRTRGAHRRPGRRGATPLAALAALLDRHGYAPPSRDDFTEESVIAAMADGPAAPAYLLALADRCRFDGRSLIESALAARARSAADGPIREARCAAPRTLDLEAAFALVFETLGEERPGQLEMARVVRRALREDAVALLEAGTGTGKSLAYLVPAILHSYETGERIVVSTHTKNLQDQLLRREVPVLERALSLDARAERLLGRANYLCARSIVSRASILMDADAEGALAFALYASLSDDGTVDSLGPLPGGVDARSLAAPQRCGMNACALAAQCPLVAARRRAREARLLFVNHALLLTDHRQGGAGIGPYARVVFDEAHHLERCAIENLSVRASREDLRRILEPLSLSDRESERWKLLEHELESSTERGGGRRLFRELLHGARELEGAYASLFRDVASALNPGGSTRSTRTRYTDGGATFAEVRESLMHIYHSINTLSQLLKPVGEIRVPQDLAPFQQAVTYASEELATLSEALRFLSDGSDEESVFWLDWAHDGSLAEICGSPLEVDRPFADYLEGFLGSAVLTSATLSQNGSFAFVRERLGLRLLSSKPVELVIPSPFPFDENCLVLVVSDLGDPNDDAFASPVSDIVAELARRLGRRSMVLFTSYRLCRSVAEGLAERGIEGPVFVQGSGESREALSERFRLHPGGVLLGVASFWEGVDFPGDELEVLVIPKIPFPVPAEPVVEARSQRLSALGEDPFEKLFLPEAILRMRQGAGRLIRREDDRGVIVILDSRLGVRSYGRAILSALPSAAIEHVSGAECVSRAAEWLEGR